MRKPLLLIVLFSLSVTIGYTQAIDTVKAAFEEQYASVTAFKDVFFETPALKAYQRNFDFARIKAAYYNKQDDVFLPQKGSGLKGFYIDASSYYKRKNKLTLWGNANYSNHTTLKVKYNESLDYDLIYPYVMADTVGGDIKLESYAISGGLSKQMGKVNYGFKAGYFGQQNYRDRDPRPNNISSKIDIALSAAITVNKSYKTALNLEGGKYNQRNALSFVNELGYPLIYHDAGLGAFNTMLAGDRSTAYVNATSWSPSISLVTIKEKGFLFKTGYHQFALQKRLSDINDNIAVAAEDIFFVDFGYVKNRAKTTFVLVLNTKMKERKGTEAIFNNTGGSYGYQKIAEKLSFTDDVKTIGLSGSLEKKFNTYSWALGSTASFEQHEMRYITPARFLSYNRIGLSGFANIQVKIKKSSLRFRIDVMKAFILNSSYRWPDVSASSGIFNMLSGTNQFYTTPFYSIVPSINFSESVNKKFLIYFDVSSRFTKYESDYNYNGKALTATLGFAF